MAIRSSSEQEELQRERVRVPGLHFDAYQSNCVVRHDQIAILRIEEQPAAQERPSLAGATNALKERRRWIEAKNVTAQFHIVFVKDVERCDARTVACASGPQQLAAFIPNAVRIARFLLHDQFTVASLEVGPPVRIAVRYNCWIE